MKNFGRQYFLLQFQCKVAWTKKMPLALKKDKTSYNGPKKNNIDQFGGKKNQFKIAQFLDFPIIITIWQLLD